MTRPTARAAAWWAAGAAVPAASAAGLAWARDTVPNSDIALLITGAVIVIACSGRRGAAGVAAISAGLSYDYFHTLPYHSLKIANHNDALATVALGAIALVVGQVAAHASAGHLEVVLVVAAAALSQAVPEPARFLIDHRGLDLSLAVLVFVTAIGIRPAAVRGLGAHARRLIVALASTTVALPALSWGLSHMVGSLALRRGVLTIGLAPAEIASVATTSLAGGDGAIAAGVLVASTFITVATAGVALRVLGGGSAVHVLPLPTNLSVVVAVPMAAGLGLRTRITLSGQHEAAAERVSVALVTLLVWLVASGAHLGRAYVGVTIALGLFVAGSALLGRALGYRAPAPVATALLLTTSMRDFAVAAAIAVAAFGAEAAAPLGIYGVVAIVWGMVLATVRRGSAGRVHRSAARDAPTRVVSEESGEA